MYDIVMSRLPACLRDAEREAEPSSGDSPLQDLREHFVGMFAFTAHEDEECVEQEPALPSPRRSAASARARAEATVARRSPAELWGRRVRDTILVVVVTSIA